MCPFIDDDEIENGSSSDKFSIGGVSEFFKQDRRLLLIGGGVAFVVFASIIGLMTSSPTVNIDELPVIHAEQAEFKEKPTKTTVVQHQDKVVYDNISGYNRKETERLAPKPENVVEIPDMSESGTLSDEEKRSIIQAFDELAPQKEYTVKYNKVSDQSYEHFEPALTVAENRKLQVLKNKAKLTARESRELKILEKKISDSYRSGAEIVAPLPPIKKVEKTSNNKKKRRLKDIVTIANTKETEISQATSSQKGNIMVQIASVLSKAEAEREYQRILVKNQFLKNKGKKIFKVDLGETKGIRYRIQVGPFRSKEEAKKIIDALKANGRSAYISK